MALDYYLDLGPYVRPAPDWGTVPRFGQGAKPASWDHGSWPEGETDDSAA